ncbi:MAG: gfo/Idh/MocA family oxidoreductase [Chloroflexi bacterium]|nr:MAG: gfo/Idh/MocA family oxidoreductase [Chloroflexota bacterium]
METKYRVGIAGAGIGWLHAAAFQELGNWFEICSVCDINEARALNLAETCGAKATTDFQQLLEQKDLDIIDICTPSYLHTQQTLAALRAGKHVILEKPAAGSLREVDEMIAADRSSEKRILPIFQQRLGVGVQKLKFLQSRGLTGRAYLCVAETAWRRRPEYYETWHGRWATELGGPLVTLGIHAHDVAMHVLGPAKRVSAQIATLVNPIETEDCAAISMQMEDGSMASFSVTTGCAREITRHHFCFSRLSAESNFEPYGNTSEPWTFSGDTPEIDQEIEQALLEFKPLPEGIPGLFYRYYQAIEKGTELPVTLQDARRSIELITAIYYSARTGQTVGLPIESDHPYYNGWFE